MIYKKQAIPSTLGFSNFPETFYTNLPAVVNIYVEGYGLIKGTTGKRWWDSSVLTANGVITLPANSTLTLPFTGSFLNPGFLVDLFVKVQLNGVVYWYAASNSPDNQIESSPTQQRKLFHIPLYCFGLPMSGNPNANNHFIQGGNSGSMSDDTPVPVYFLEPTDAAGTITAKVIFVPYIGAAPGGVFTTTTSYSAGVSSVNLFSPSQIKNFYNNLGYFLIDVSGFYKIELVCSDNSYTSMLNFYHWGQSN